MGFVRGEQTLLHGLYPAWPHHTALVMITAALWIACPAIDAGMINVNLGDNARSTLNGPAGGAGTLWNAWRMAGSSLQDASGNDTGVNFTAAGDGPYGDWWCDLELLTGGVFDSGGGTLPFVMTGLDPGKTYDLYIASSYGQSGGCASFWISNNTNTPSPQTADNQIAGNATTWVRGTNFVLFQDVEPDASGQINLTYGGVGTYGMLNGFQLVEISQPALSFDAWAASPAQGLTVGTNAGPLDDPDHDGVVNLLEFALGGAPLVFSPEILPKLTDSGGRWVFEYDRSDHSRPPGTTQVVEYSNDMVTWIPVIVPTISSGNVTITDGGEFDHVSVVIPVQGTPLFARLRVTR